MSSERQRTGRKLKSSKSGRIDGVTEDNTANDMKEDSERDDCDQRMKGRYRRC